MWLKKKVKKTSGHSGSWLTLNLSQSSALSSTETCHTTFLKKVLVPFHQFWNQCLSGIEQQTSQSKWKWVLVFYLKGRDIVMAFINTKKMQLTSAEQVLRTRL